MRHRETSLGGKRINRDKRGRDSGTATQRKRPRRGWAAMSDASREWVGSVFLGITP